MATTYDIAKMAGVDQSSVSKILNGATNFKQETIDKVKSACQALDYIPNATAHQLRSQRTNTIAINIPFSRHAIQADPFILEFLAGVSQQTSDAGYGILLSYNDSESALSDIVLGRRADGIILTSTKANDPRISQLIAKGIPFVAGKTQHLSAKNAACVDVDNYDCGRIAGEFLIRKGHRKIAVLYHDNSYSGMDFAAGVRAAMGNRKIFSNDEYFVKVDISATAAIAAAEKLLAMPTPPTAITSNIFLAAFGLQKAVEHKDCAILAPESLLFRQLYPQQPCIKVPTIELGQQMAATLIKILDAQPFPKLHLLQTQITGA